jgi:hypothetical protein
MATSEDFQAALALLVSLPGAEIGGDPCEENGTCFWCHGRNENYDPECAPDCSWFLFKKRVGLTIGGDRANGKRR